MKNIIEICKDFGMEIPAEKREDFLKAVNGEYKTVAEHQKVADKLGAVTDDLKKANTTIQQLEANAKDSAALQKTIDDYKAAEVKRQAEEKAAAERADRLSRFDKAHAEAAKDRKWLNDYTKNGIFAEFEKALADEANKGKSDAQIYNALVNDDKGVKAGLFAPQINGYARMPGMGADPGSAQTYVNNKYKGNPFLNGTF